MATAKRNDNDPDPGHELSWTEFAADGTERTRSGRVWDRSQPVRGSKAWWVTPDGETTPVLVARCSRRRRVGRMVMGTRDDLAGGRVPVERWAAQGGRYVDKGEFYREADPRAGMRPAWRVPVVADTFALAMFASACEEMAAGRDPDLSVRAADVAHAVDVARTVDEEVERGD